MVQVVQIAQIAQIFVPKVRRSWSKQGVRQGQPAVRVFHGKSNTVLFAWHMTSFTYVYLPAECGQCNPHRLTLQVLQRTIGETGPL